MLDKNQSWFWTKEWQADEQQAQEDIKSNRIYTTTNVNDFLKELKNQQIVKMIKERDKLDNGVRYSIDEAKKHRANIRYRKRSLEK